MLGINGLNVLNSYVGRDFMTSIELRDLGGFHRNAWLYLLVFLGSTLVAVFFRFAEERLGLVWREQLTRRLADSYLEKRTYYQLDSATGVANPDQRIADDVRAFTTTTLSFTLLVLNGSLAALAFSAVLWSISPSLFGVALGYAICGSILTVWLGKPLLKLNHRQLEMEASFRAELIHVRENSETIALAHREGRFKARVNQRIDDLTGNFRKLIGANRNLGFFTTGYNYMMQLIPALIVAPLFIRGELRDFGVITQAAMAFSTLLGALSLIVTQFQSISAFTEVTSRLTGLSEAMERAIALKPCNIAVNERPGGLVFAQVTLDSSDGRRRLVTGLNLTIRPGESWVVVGNDDEPKVALLHAMADIWEQGSGRIERPCLDEILFLPERPYLPPGMLWDILVRTDNEQHTAKVDVLAALDRLELTEVVNRLGGLKAEEDWDDLLTIGEQHLLSVVRIILAKPSLVVLDRPGSVLPKEQIRRILDLLHDHGMGVLVLAKNGETEIPFDGQLRLSGDGAWRVSRT